MRQEEIHLQNSLNSSYLYNQGLKWRRHCFCRNYSDTSVYLLIEWCDDNCRSWSRGCADWVQCVQTLTAQHQVRDCPQSQAILRKLSQEGPYISLCLEMIFVQAGLENFLYKQALKIKSMRRKYRDKFNSLYNIQFAVRVVTYCKHFTLQR
jgi:hypothetical protein